MPEDPHLLTEPGETEPGQGEPGGVGGSGSVELGPFPFVQEIVMREADVQMILMGE